MSLRRGIYKYGKQQLVQFNISHGADIYAAFPETGGLLRMGVKIMMACGTTNIDVYASLGSTSELS